MIYLGGIYGQTKYDIGTLFTCLRFSHGKIVVHEEMLIETIVGNQIPSPWCVMFSTRDGSQQKITKYENGIKVAQNELFPTYVEIGIDDDNDFQGSSSYYIDSLLTIKDRDHIALDFFVIEMEFFSQTKLYRWLHEHIITLLFHVPHPNAR